MVWILIAMSAGSYNYGTISGIEFYDKNACNDARIIMKSEFKYVNTICVPKSSVPKQ